MSSTPRLTLTTWPATLTTPPPLMLVYSQHSKTNGQTQGLKAPAGRAPSPFPCATSVRLLQTPMLSRNSTSYSHTGMVCGLIGVDPFAVGTFKRQGISLILRTCTTSKVRSICATMIRGIELECRRAGLRITHPSFLRSRTSLRCISRHNLWPTIDGN